MQAEYAVTYIIKLFSPADIKKFQDQSQQGKRNKQHLRYAMDQFVFESIRNLSRIIIIFFINGNFFVDQLAFYPVMLFCAGGQHRIVFGFGFVLRSTDPDPGSK